LTSSSADDEIEENDLLITSLLIGTTYLLLLAFLLGTTGGAQRDGERPTLEKKVIVPIDLILIVSFTGVELVDPAGTQERPDRLVVAFCCLRMTFTDPKFPVKNASPGFSDCLSAFS
jgi:hypothetical protein